MLPVLINNKKLGVDKVAKKIAKKETKKLETLLPNKKDKEEDDWDIWDILAFSEWEEECR